ncbi:hypothetical protein ACJMK2_037442, partial [Sinanodonta woodiana]
MNMRNRWNQSDNFFQKVCHVVMTSHTKPNSAAVNMVSEDENRPSRMNTDVPSTSGSTHYQKLHSEQ